MSGNPFAGPSVKGPDPLVAAAQPTTIQQARNAGAVEGTPLVAPLAPAIGPITVNVADVVPAKTVTAPDGTKTTTPAQEPMVVVAVKAFWSSPTIIKARRIIIGCIATGVIAGGGILATAISAGKNVWELPWGQAGTTLLTVALGALIAAMTAALTTGYFALQKVSDNNPIQSLPRREQP